MSKSSDMEERVGRLENSVAEMAAIVEKTSRVHESNLRVILMVFQFLQRYRAEYVGGFRLFASDSTFAAAVSRRQVLGLISRHEMESEMLTEVMNDAIAKLCEPGTVRCDSFGSTVSPGL
jgi:hypothetical protein